MFVAIRTKKPDLCKPCKLSFESRQAEAAPFRQMIESTSRRVLLLSSQPWFEWRGSPIRVGFNLEALTAAGHTVDFVTLPVGASREIPGVNVIRVANPLRIRKVPIGPSLSKLFFDFLILLRALRLLRRGRYCMIHGIEDAGLVAWVAGRISGVPFIYEKHSDPGSYCKSGLRNLVMWCYSAIEQRVTRAAAAVIATGPGLEKQAEAAGARKVFCIPDIPSSRVNATCEGIHAARQSMVGKEQCKLVLYVGSFAVYQGIDLLFDSIPLVVRECPQVRFAVIGGTREEITERRVQLEKEGVSGAVVFPGFVAPDTLPDYLSAADVLLSSRLSGVNTPLKLLDYLKAGGVVVATDCAANRLILDAGNALLAQPEAKAFASAIVQAVRDEKLRQRLSGAGAKLISEVHNFTEFSRRLHKCYESVLTGARD